MPLMLVKRCVILRCLRLMFKAGIPMPSILKRNQARCFIHLYQVARHATWPEGKWHVHFMRWHTLSQPIVEDDSSTLMTGCAVLCPCMH